MKKVLIANRGEIAVRIIKTLKKLNIQSVAVFSEIDRNSLHVKMADEAFFIGKSPSSESYLNIDTIIKTALECKADAIHPGYGFLSENSVFAEKVTQAGIEFIGPTPAAMRIMGSKLEAKAAVIKFDVPLAPGTDSPVTKVENALEIAQQIGYPVLVKASAGGGGKGMRIVKQHEEMEEQFHRAVSEATSAFGDGSVFIEKYISSPRHIEMQVLADKYGNIIHLNERECSIQRRHQKVIEEAPSVVISAEIREKLGKAAVDVARSCNYVGAGTVEFLLDNEMNFYFLEMNTRLQVEHPVTEFITGLDLVEEQIRIASGEKLRFRQKNIKLKGHAIELRVYAEDPENNFLPSIGKLTEYIEPSGSDIRVDSGFEEGMEIPIYYDPMISKLIVYGKDRTNAVSLMKKAITSYKIKGIKTTLPFGELIMNHQAFTSGNFDTHFIEKYFDNEAINRSLRPEAEVAALFAVHNYKKHTGFIKEPTHDKGKWG
ncbi:MAG: acetyl-CoA carboxylase biotin carboxylase subunit [Deltaproteobacteria bacterium]